MCSTVCVSFNIAIMGTVFKQGIVSFVIRESMSNEEQAVFWRNIQCTVEKDVVRTDRSHPYFRGEDNPNIEVLK